MAERKKTSKKQNANNSVKKAPKSKFLVFLIILFCICFCDLLWTYIVPICLNSKYPTDVISKSLSEKLGFNVKASSSNFYTTQSLSVGLNINNLVLSYPQAPKKYEFLNSRVATFEFPLIPYILKTLKFNKFDFRIVEIELYQDENGNYVYLDQIKNGFNPNMKDYQLEVPTINLVRYTFKNFNAKTQDFKVLKGKKKVISPSVSKLVLKETKEKSIRIK